jgi:hypothetical protein
MSSAAGPNVVTSGLVLDYDMSNTQKSWKGAPTTNLHPIDGYINWPSQTVHFWNGNNWVVDSTYTDPGAPGPAGTYIGKVRKYTSGALSATWSGNSYAYVLKTAAMTSGQNYAMSSYVYMSSNCDIDYINPSIEGASVSALSGGYPTGYNTVNKGTWQRTGLTGTAAANVNYIPAYAAKYGVTTGIFTGFFMVGGIMVENGIFPTPYTDGTRSTAESIIDLTNKNTITTNSLTYASDNTFSYNGSSNSLTVPFNATNFTFNNEQTIIIWMKNQSPSSARRNPYNQAYAGAGTITHENDTVFNYYYGTGGGDNTPYTAHTSPFSVVVSETAMICITRNTTQTAWYKNGVLGNTQSNPYGIVVTGTSNITIGSGYAGYFGGNIYAVQMYNRALSAAEVAQNFNATRSRYGL